MPDTQHSGVSNQKYNLKIRTNQRNRYSLTFNFIGIGKVAVSYNYAKVKS